MRSHIAAEFDDQFERGELGYESGARPERLSRVTANRRNRKPRSTTRNRSSEVAKRGIHQRRNKRCGW